MYRVTFFTICCVLLLSSRAVGFAPIGPAACDLDQGQFAIGTDYVKGDFKTSFENLYITVEGVGTQRLPGGSDIEFELDGYSGKVSYGVSDQCLVFVSLYRDGWGFGSKMTLRESTTLDWGLTTRIDFVSDEDVIYSPFVRPGNWLYAKAQYDFYAVRIAAGPVYKSDGLRLYGGPFLFWASGDGDFEGKYVYSDGTPVDVKSSWDIIKIELGGYIGVSLELVENIEVQAEYQIADDLSIFGAGLSFKF